MQCWRGSQRICGLSSCWRSTESLLQFFLLLMRKVARDELEMRCPLEGLDDFVGLHRAEQQEKTGCALSHLGTHLLDEVVVDAIAAEVRAQRPDCGADGDTDYRYEKENPEQQPPEGAVEGTGGTDARVLARLGPLLAGRPRD